MVEEAIAEYDLPVPDYVIGDVGTSLYSISDGVWSVGPDWQDEIQHDWAGYTSTDLAAALASIDRLRIQEPAKQGPFKLSYYAAPLSDPGPLLAQVEQALDATVARCRLVWSIDETTATGLLDVLPVSASKLHALLFLRDRLGVAPARTVFAGDSGNDMEVLVSGVPSVLVANAQPNVRDAAVAGALAAGHGDALYLAQGGLAGMNGNYSAGILEGVAHYLPAMRTWLGV